MVNKHFSSQNDNEDFDSIENIEVLDTEEQNTSDNTENSRNSSRRQGKATNDDLTRSIEIHKRQNGDIRKPRKVPPAPPGYGRPWPKAQCSNFEITDRLRWG